MIRSDQEPVVGQRGDRGPTGRSAQRPAGPVPLNLLFSLSFPTNEPQRSSQSSGDQPTVALSSCHASLGLRLPGGHLDQPGVSARPLPHPLHQEAVFPQSADLLHRPGHRDALLQRRAAAHPRGLDTVAWRRRGRDPSDLLRLQALGFDPDTDSYVSNATGICGGFYMLFFVEKLLKMALKVEHQVGGVGSCDMAEIKLLV